MDNGQVTNIVEALLFAAAEPLPAKSLCRAVEGMKEDDILQAVETLNDRYIQSDSSFRIREIAGGFQLHTLPKYADYIDTLLARTKVQRLSAAALETLAVVAYRQPVSTPEIEKIRGVESSGVLRTLLERNLVAITGRSDGPGRPLLYGTTRDFLYYFGLNELRELPRIEELEKLLENQDFSRQLSIELDLDAVHSSEKPAILMDTASAGETAPEPPADEETPSRQLVMKRTMPESAEPDDKPVRLKESLETSRDGAGHDESDEQEMTEMDVPVPQDDADQDENGELLKTAKDVLETSPD